MIAGHLRRLCSALILVFTIVAASLCASGATPFTGFYMGTMYVSISGNIMMPERAAGPAGINIHEDGTVTSSGDLAGTVDSAGNITWVLPNSGNFITGKVENGVIASTGSVNNDGTISTFRIHASNSAPGFGGTSPLAGRIEQVNPKQSLRGMTRIRYTNGQFMAVGTRGSIAFSDDGLTWRRFGVTTTLALYDIAYGNGIYVAVGDSGVVFTSPDGDIWIDKSVGGSATLAAVIYADGKFTALGSNSISATSEDGLTWTTIASGGPVYSSITSITLSN